MIINEKVKEKYTKLCDKIGFDPLVNYPSCNEDTEDDSRANPYGKLNCEETDFMADYCLTVMGLS